MIIFVGYEKSSEDVRNKAISEYERMFCCSLGKFNYNEQGKPCLEKGCISVSHTDNIVIVAIGKEDIGIDIENKSRKITIGKTIEEWTEIEAYLKWSGRGITMDFMNIEVPKNMLSKLNISDKYCISVFSTDKELIVNNL